MSDEQTRRRNTEPYRWAHRWVWCERSDMPEPASEHYYGEDGTTPQPCPGTHHPILVDLRISTRDQQLSDAGDDDG